ncbi:MAG TPA: hypothetical protein VGD43_21380, partial [Micromonospora sp.]
MSGLVAASLVAGLLIVPSSASANPGVPVGAEVTSPRQRAGSAAGADHTAAAVDTAAGDRPTGLRPLPPSAKGVVGPEKLYPDPPSGSAGKKLPGGGEKRPDGVDLPPQEVRVDRATVTGFVPGQSRELPETRTESSTTFVNPDGTKTLRMYSAPKHVRDAAGRMVPFDLNVERGGDNRFRPRAGREVSFAAGSTDPQLATMRFGEGLEASFSVVGVTDVAAVADGGNVRFDGVRTDADLVLGPTNRGLKELIVLRSPAAPTVWDFPLRLRGLTAKLVEGAGRVDLVDATGKVRGQIPPGFMTDSVIDQRTGQGTRSNGVTYSLVEQNGGWVLRVSLDRSWLLSADRRYPVTVDPTMRTPTFDDTFVNTRDFKNRDNSAETFLAAGTWTSGAD